MDNKKISFGCTIDGEMETQNQASSALSRFGTKLNPVQVYEPLHKTLESWYKTLRCLLSRAIRSTTVLIGSDNDCAIGSTHKSQMDHSSLFSAPSQS